MEIVKLVLGACVTNCYIVSSLAGNAVVIDPADEADQIIEEIQKRKLHLRYIFITHGHTDHILALKAVRDFYQVPVVISKLDAGRLEDEVLINERPYVTAPYQAVRPDILLQDGDRINLDELSFSFYAMPGHTPGSMAIITDRIIFSGDTLLFENHGKTSLPGGCEAELIQSIRRLFQDFPEDFRILPGHRKETTLSHERECGLAIRPKEIPPVSD